MNPSAPDMRRVRMTRIAAGALALAAPLATPLQAQEESAFELEAYATLLPFADHTSIDDATASAPDNRPTQLAEAAYAPVESTGERLTGGTSNFGFRGGYAIRDDLKVIFQIESQIPIDGTQGPEGNWGSRNSRVGLAGDFGTVFVGQWDTPYKWSTMQLAAMKGINPFEYDNILENPGFGVPGTTTQGGRNNNKTDAAFSRRQANSLHYWTPDIAGFSAQFAYSFDESRSNIDSNTTTSPTILSAMAEYKTGGLTLRYAFEQHNDYFGLSQIGGSPGATATNDGSTDTGHKLVAMYSIAATKTRVAGAWETLNYENDDSAGGAVDEYSRDAWYLTINQKLGGPHAMWLSYGQADEGDCEIVGGANCVTDELGASMYSIGYQYAFNANAQLYASYYGVETDVSSQYGIFPSPTAVAPGADSTAFGVGFIVSFGAKLM